MKIKRLTPLILLLCSLSIQAQDIVEPKTKFEERLAIKFEYFGELVLHPGLSAGIEYAVVRNKWRTVHWNADFGGYWHRWNNTSIFLKTSIGSRFTIGAFFADINLGVGYMHSWAAGGIFVKSEDGGVKQTINWGHPHFMPTGSFLLGWDGSRKNDLPWSIHFGPEVYLQSSFNHIFLPHVAVKIGFTYKFNKQ